MPVSRRLWPACLLVLAPVLLHAGEDWARLKLGMTPEAATAVLGEPLIRTAGDGFEVWIYDSRAEALFYGPLIGWTTPHAAGATGKVVDVWQPGPKGRPAEVFFLPRPVPVRTKLSSRREGGQGDANKLPSYRIR